MKINGFTRVATSDVIAKDGTMHLLNDVLIPPKKPGSIEGEDPQQLTVDQLMESLEYYVDDIDDVESIKEDSPTGRIEL